MGRRVEPERVDRDDAQLTRRARQIDMRLGVLTASDSDADLRREVERMRAAAEATDDPVERLRLAVDCAASIRPRLVARHEGIATNFPDYADWRP